jgi:hypothetical protein
VQHEGARRAPSTSEGSPSHSGGVTTFRPRRQRTPASFVTHGESTAGDWALSFVDRAPFLWRFRHLRCRLLEIREEADR